MPKMSTQNETKIEIQNGTTIESQTKEYKKSNHKVKNRIFFLLTRLHTKAPFIYFWTCQTTRLQF
jgi:hypothetical protein